MSSPIIPLPDSIQEAGGTVSAQVPTSVTMSTERLRPLVDVFRTDLRTWTGRELDPPRVASSAVPAGIHFTLTDDGPATPLAPLSAASLGEHALTVDERGVLVESATEEGLARGAATVIQLLRAQDGPRGVRIHDRAHWGWRGLSLDVVRSFVPLERVLRIVDLLALYKFNVLHLHLSDNEAWRLELPGWPRLTPDTEAGREYFTLAEYGAIVRYAAERFITVVPEIDLPGHVGAALRAYPELNPIDAERLEGPFPIANLSVDAPRSWALVDDVVRTLVDHTPGPFIHVGGDEAFGMDGDAHIAFVERAVAALRAAGKKTIGWQETSRADIGSEHIAQYWVDFRIDDEGAEREPSGADAIAEESLAAMVSHFAEAARDGERIGRKGMQAVLSPISHAYVDRPHAEASVDAGQDAARSGLGFAYYPPTPISAYLEWDARDVLPAVDLAKVAGVEAALWCESVRGPADIDALLMPRLPAVAEVAWAGSGRRDWPVFRNALAEHAVLWDEGGWAWYQADSVAWRRRIGGASAGLGEGGASSAVAGRAS